MSIYRQRRSLKPLDMDPNREVPRETLLSLLEDAHWAPTHGLTQPWRFHVFQAPESRAALADQLQAIYDEIIPAEARDEAKREKLGKVLRHAPLVIALAAKVEPGGKIPEWEEIAATSCAAQNLMLSAHEQGIGSYWSTPPVTCSAEFGQWLGLDETHRVLGLLYLGYLPEGAKEPRSTRAPLETRVVWHGEA
ncbi:MAG: nitroreductase [Verrucomicrobiota bacterium JB023]|nr:nitroreductase [Verrucomicrobiota bacterium JB023]